MQHSNSSESVPLHSVLGDDLMIFLILPAMHTDYLLCEGKQGGEEKLNEKRVENREKERERKIG